MAEVSKEGVDSNELILIPVRDMVVFPGVVLPVAVKRAKSEAAAQEAVRAKRKVGFVLQRDSQNNDPGASDLYRVGTVATIARFVTGQDGVHHLIVQGEQRFELQEIVQTEPYLKAKVVFHAEVREPGREAEARGIYLRERAVEAVRLLPQVPAELLNTIQSMESPAQLADLVTSFMDLSSAEKQQILEAFELSDRLDRVIAWLAKRIEVLKISRDIGEKTREAFDERQKEAVLREQLRQIRRELGEDEHGTAVEVN